MSNDLLSDNEIVHAWHANAAPWTAAVRRGDIQSRRLVTDQAIIDAVLSCSPQSVLDVGCEEGWLARALSAKKIRVIGVDVVPELIRQAQAAGGNDFRVSSYEEIAAGKLDVRVDAVVCNFSLIGKESVDGMMKAAASLLQVGGSVVVQTLHPLIACGDHAYEDGWREGSWAGFSNDFTRPAPWYFRTVETWLHLFEKSGLRLKELREPLHPNTGKPASMLFIASAVE